MMSVGQETSREEWEAYLERHKRDIRNAIEQHRDINQEWWTGQPSDIDFHQMSLSDAFIESHGDLPGVEYLSPARYAHRGNGKPPRKGRGRSEQVYIGEDAAFMCLLPHHIPRRWAIFIVESRWFDPIILLTIGMNCFTMAWVSPLDPPDTDKMAFVAICEWVYLYIFTAELLLKMLAYGVLFMEGAYLRQAWCQLDFVIVSLAWCVHRPAAHAGQFRFPPLHIHSIEDLLVLHPALISLSRVRRRPLSAGCRSSSPPSVTTRSCGQSVPSARSAR